MRTWIVPAVGGALLALALLMHGSGGTAVMRTPPGSPPRSTAEPREAVVLPSRVEPEIAAATDGGASYEQDRAERKDAIRETFWKYRSAVACDDDTAERTLYPLLLLDRDASLECAREEVDRAPTELDQAIARKAEQALKERIARSEEP